MEFMADGRADRGQGAAWESDRRPRRGKSEGTGSGVSRGVARDPRREQENAGESGDGGGRRRGNRFASYQTTRASSGSPATIQEMRSHFHPVPHPRFLLPRNYE